MRRLVAAPHELPLVRRLFKGLKPQSGASSQLLHRECSVTVSQHCPAVMTLLHNMGTICSLVVDVQSLSIGLRQKARITSYDKRLPKSAKELEITAASAYWRGNTHHEYLSCIGHGHT